MLPPDNPQRKRGCAVLRLPDFRSLQFDSPKHLDAQTSEALSGESVFFRKTSEVYNPRFEYRLSVRDFGSCTRLGSVLGLFLSFFALLSSQAHGQKPVKPRPVKLAGGGEFLRALGSPISASKPTSDLKTTLAALAEGQHVAVWLDRRLDPNQPASLEVSQIPLRFAFEKLAVTTQTEVSITGHTIFVGPPETTKKLRTLAALRTKELTAKNVKLANSRESYFWDDLDQPADLVRSWTKAANLSADGLDQIPHDRWAAGRTGPANIAEVLVLTLGQFDLTFEWSSKKDVKIIPIPDEVFVEREHHPNGRVKLAELQTYAERLCPKRVSLDKNKLLVRGTEEEHEAIHEYLVPPQVAVANPLANRLIDLTVVRKPGRVVLQVIEKEGIVLQYDEQKLKAAGIDLDKPINLNIKQATPKRFFSTLCDELDLDFEIIGEKVILAPRKLPGQ